MAAPFEGREPLVQLPGQALTSVESVLLAALAAWAIVGLREGARPDWRTPLTRPWLAFLAAALAASLAADDRSNALHMTGRFALAFGVYLLVVNGVTSFGRLRAFLGIAAATGGVVAGLVMLEYLDAGGVAEWLRRFRGDVAHVGGQTRAGGPFHYPTIASMYLEILFALTLGLLMLAVDARRHALLAALALAALAMAEAVALTFTRAGFISLASSLVVVGFLAARHRGAGRRRAAIALIAVAIGVELLASRSLDVLRVRMTTEGQNAWFQAAIDAPADLTFATGTASIVPVTVTNSGLSRWDPRGVNRSRLSYHWLLADEDRVAIWEGVRTDLPRVLHPGERVTLNATVVAPARPGRYRLLWDIEQENRLWFSTEPDAELFVTHATVTGPEAPPIEPSALPPLPKRATRPGRLVLWGAAARMVAERPLLGVGPDGFRLRYGGFAGLPDADPRLHANNMYIEVLAGGGILTALAFLWLCWSAAGQARAMARHASDSPLQRLASGVVAAAAAVALHGLVDSFLGFTATYILIAITLGLLVAANRLAHAHRP